jgi:hypothetical protein
MYSTDSNKEYCITLISLVVLKNTLMMHGPMNVKFKILMIGTAHQMGWACGTYGKEEKYIQGFGMQT